MPPWGPWRGMGHLSPSGGIFPFHGGSFFGGFCPPFVAYLHCQGSRSLVLTLRRGLNCAAFAASSVPSLDASWIGVDPKFWQRFSMAVLVPNLVKVPAARGMHHRLVQDSCDLSPQFTVCTRYYGSNSFRCGRARSGVYEVGSVHQCAAQHERNSVRCKRFWIVTHQVCITCRFEQV